MRTIILAACVMALFLPNTAGSMGIVLSLEQVVQEADVILVGTLGPTRGWNDRGFDMARGPIAVSRVIWGDIGGASTVMLEWENVANIVCEELVWFLEHKEDDVYTARNVANRKPLSWMPRVRTVLRHYPFQIDIPRGFGPGDRPVIRITFRNASLTPLSIPGVRVRDGRVEHDPVVEIALWGKRNGSFESLPFRHDRLVENGNIEPVTLAPGESFEIPIDLGALVDSLPPGPYRFGMRLQAQDRLVQHFFSIYTAEGARYHAAWENHEFIPYTIAVLEGREPGNPAYVLNWCTSFGKAATAVVPAAQAFHAREDDPDLRLGAVRLISSTDDDAARRLAFFGELLESDDARIRGQALQALRATRIPPEKQAEFMERMLELINSESEPEQRRAGVVALQGCESTPELQAMLETLAEVDGDPNVRAAAVGVLRHFERRSGAVTRCRPQSAD